MTKIYAPNPAFTGVSVGVVFNDGVGELAADADAAKAYFKAAGYGVGKKAEAPDLGPVPDARDVVLTGPHVGGGTLRDAAVDPHPEDFLPPTNAGKADPHGPLVVAPEIHASGPKGIRPGEVFVGEPGPQNDAETELAQSVLVDNEEHPSMEKDPDMGPIGMSDPGSVEMGQQASDGGVPAKSASKAAWADYAAGQGMAREEADASTRADLIDRYGGG